MILIILMLLIVLSIIISKNKKISLSSQSKVKVYASLTSIPSRLDKTKKVIDRILEQTYPVEHIIFNIPKEKFRTGKEYFIPNFLLENKYKNKVTVVRSKEYGPGTKLVGGLEHIPYNSFVYVVDDDMHYPKNHLELLLSHLDNTTDVVSNLFCFYNRGLGNKGICGFSGFIVNRNILDDIVAYYNNISKECITVDDVWISKYLMKKNAKFKFGNIIDNIEITIDARYKDLFIKDPTSLSNTANKNNLNIFSNKSNNSICEKYLNTKHK